ncbi:hypothetical protein Y032_0021g389 [Ancylostoma ceylanicum]|uniref:Uncharacterized protein n=1 Tax=Ancylostoma ceylanicum TaxID=53326 RepID=A0A016UZW0_9BILA|nr:hypothetical protein Y032_0021g389 [Ancylostoma ceylanicum]
MRVFQFVLALLWFSAANGCEVRGRNAWWGTVSDAPVELVRKIRDFTGKNVLDSSTLIKFEVDYGYGDVESVVFISLIDTYDLHCFVIDQLLGRITEKDVAQCREILESCTLIGPFPRNMLELLGSPEHYSMSG